MTRFLKNPKTGQIVRSNPFLEKRTDLKPCAPPWDGQSDDDEYVELAPVYPPAGQGATLISKEEGAALVKEWFGRDVSRVTLKEMFAFAAEKGIDVPETASKIEIVSLIKAAL